MDTVGKVIDPQDLAMRMAHDFNVVHSQAKANQVNKTKVAAIPGGGVQIQTPYNRLTIKPTNTANEVEIATQQPVRVKAQGDKIIISGKNNDPTQVHIDTKEQQLTLTTRKDGVEASGMTLDLKTGQVKTWIDMNNDGHEQSYEQVPLYG